MRLRVDVDDERLRFAYQVEGALAVAAAAVRREHPVRRGDCAWRSRTSPARSSAWPVRTWPAPPCPPTSTTSSIRNATIAVQSPHRKAERIMEFSRREFVSAGIAGAAGNARVGWRSLDANLETAPAMLPDEDGYKLWLRFAPLWRLEPPATAKRNRMTWSRAPQATARIYVDEMTAATAAMLGASMPVVPAGRGRALVIGTPANSGVIRGPRLEGRARQGWPGRVRHSRARGSPIVTSSRSRPTARSARSTERFTSCA